MNKGFKKAFSLFGIVFLFVSGLSAQQNHFVYVQTENKQPFYIRLDKKLLSSSASGYLIIPKLQDGNYVFTVGFPMNEWPEQNVTYSVNKKDAGFLLKYFGDKGWGFFNLQTMEVIMPGAKSADNKAVGDADKQDLFSNILSDVVNDPSIVKRMEEKPEIKETVKPAEADIKREDTIKTVTAVTEKPEIKETAKPAEADIKSDTIKTIAAVTEKPETNKVIEEKPAVKKEEPVTEKQETNKMVEEKPADKKEDTVLEIVKDKPTIALPSQIKKLFSVKSSEGTDIVYADISNGQSDTIRLFIPTEKKELVPVIEVPQKETIKKEEPKNEAIKKEVPVKEEPKNEAIKKEEIKKEEAKKEEPKKEEVKKDKANAPKFIDIELANPNIKKDTVTKQVTIVPVDEKKPELKDTGEKPMEVVEKPKEDISKRVIANSDCKNFASEDDFLKLRKKMAAANNDDDMLAMSKKVFKSKCFTTEQVKNLSVLFLKDEGKYKFFDVAYPFVADSYNFGTLEGQLTDNYFISRFKAMIHH